LAIEDQLDKSEDAAAGRSIMVDRCAPLRSRLLNHWQPTE